MKKGGGKTFMKISKSKKKKIKNRKKQFWKIG